MDAVLGGGESGCKPKQQELVSTTLFSDHYLPRTSVLGFSLFLAVVVAAEESGSIAGRVITADGAPVAEATVTLVDLRQQTTVDAAGRGGTVADERYGQFDLNGGASRLAWHLDAAIRETDDYSIPEDYDPEDFERDGEDEHSEHGEEFEPGTLVNSDLETLSAAAGISYFGSLGFLGLGLSGFDTSYGVPAHEHHGAEEDGEPEEGDVRVDLERRRIDFSGEITQPFSIFRGFRARLGIVDYQHMELEGAVIGTEFLKDTLEGRFEFVQQQRGRRSGSVGLQVLVDDLEAIGEEAFLPPSATRTLGLFAFEELATGRLSWQFGGRIESAGNSTRAPDLPHRSFTPLSLPVGLVWSLPREWSLGSSLA